MRWLLLVVDLLQVSNAQQKWNFYQFLKKNAIFWNARIHLICFFLQNYHTHYWCNCFVRGLYELPVYTKNKMTRCKSVMSNAQKRRNFSQILKKNAVFEELRYMFFVFFFYKITICILCSCTLLPLLNYLNYMFTPKNKMTPCKTVVSNIQKKWIFCQFLKKIAFFWRVVTNLSCFSRKLPYTSTVLIRIKT